jgi:hypothetical protein
VAVRDIARDDLVAVVSEVREVRLKPDTTYALSIEAEREEDISRHSAEPWIA